MIVAVLLEAQGLDAIVGSAMSLMATVASKVVEDPILAVLAFGFPLVAVGAAAFHRVIGR